MSGSVRILVIDDDESIRDFTHTALADAGYDVVEAADGAVALDLLGTSRPDVILLDMLMPLMDGWEFARRYHETPGPHAPLIVVTAARDAMHSLCVELHYQSCRHGVGRPPTDRAPPTS